jgi:hypothetical protein
MSAPLFTAGDFCALALGLALRGADYSFPENEPVDCKTFCALIDNNRFSTKLGQLELTAAGWNVMEVHRHAG